MRRQKLLTSLVVGVCLATISHAQRDTPCHDRLAEGPNVVIASETEPGDRMVITGRVLAGEQKEPVAGARVLAFHTDSAGYYSDGGMDESQARLCGVLATGADGRYRIETIRPAHYATGGGPPAHVHFEVSLEDGPRDQRFTLNFEGDHRLGGEKGAERWDRIRPVVVGEGGIAEVERDLWVR